MEVFSEESSLILLFAFVYFSSEFEQFPSMGFQFSVYVYLCCSGITGGSAIDRF